MNYGERIGPDGQARLGGLAARKDDIIGIDNLVIGACGTSFHAGLMGAYFFRKLGCFDTVQVVIGSEMNDQIFPRKNPGFLAVSQSGETKDLLDNLKNAKNVNAVCFNVVNRVESSLARATKTGVFINAGREISVASTKAFTCQVCVLVQTALWIAQNKNPCKSRALPRQSSPALLVQTRWWRNAPPSRAA